MKIRYNEEKVFKIGSSEICERRQPLKELQWHGLLKHTISLQIFQKLSSANFTWSILEYFFPTKAAAKPSLVIIRRLFRKVSQNYSENADVGALSSWNNSENTGDSTFLKVLESLRRTTLNSLSKKSLNIGGFFVCRKFWVHYFFFIWCLKPGIQKF